jgi:hypothetical protein
LKRRRGALRTAAGIGTLTGVLVLVACDPDLELQGEPVWLTAFESMSWMLAVLSLLLYECVLRRLKWIRPLFGMKLNRA